MITVFGSINLDIIFPLTAIPVSGETLLTPTVTLMPGGKGANQAVAAARDGASVAMAGAVGRDAMAEPALALLRAAGIDLSRVVATDTATGCAAILVDPAGGNAIAVGSGANLLARADQVEDARLGRGHTLLLQMEVDGGETATLIRRARATGGRVVLNLAPAAALPDDVWPMVDWLVVNETEAAWLAARHGAAADATGLARCLGTKIVRTLGGAGLEMATADGAWRLPAHRITPIDTTAAGDCFVGVFAAGLDRGLADREAARRAGVAATLCCTRAGSQASLPRACETDAELCRWAGLDHGPA